MGPTLLVPRIVVPEAIPGLLASFLGWCRLGIQFQEDTGGAWLGSKRNLTDRRDERERQQEEG